MTKKMHLKKFKKIIGYITFFLLSIPGRYGLVTEPCAQYNSQSEHPAYLRGRIYVKECPGPPNYESISSGDKPEQVWLLDLQSNVCFTDISGKKSWIPVRFLQLVLKKSHFPKVKNNLGALVTVKGKTFTAQTGHHRTEILLDVEELNVFPQSKDKPGDIPWKCSQD